MIENRSSDRDAVAVGADIPISPVENFAGDVYSSVDKAAVCELARLRREDGIISSCKSGCCQCCRYHILSNITEARTLAQYVKRKFSQDQITDLRRRTQKWHEWDNSRPGRYPSAGSGETTDFSGYEHCCPLLVNGKCSAYPVRPVVCRTHFVCSHPRFCCTANDPESTEAPPVVLTSVVTATSPFSMAIRCHIERAGLDFSRSIMLLPHGLAIEMGWDFAISL